MLENSIFYPLGCIVVGATLCMILARMIRLPSIVACLLAGLMLGPATGIIENSEALMLISEIGIVLLLFLVGLEVSIEKFSDVGKVALFAGLAQVVATILLGGLFAWLLGFDVKASLFLSLAFTFASTVVMVKVLTDKNELDSVYGRIAVGISLVQDLVVIFVLTILTGLGTSGGIEGGTVATGLLKAFGGMGLLLGVVLLASKYLLPKPFSWIASSPSTLFIWSLSWCFAVVSLAYWLNLSLALGAFFAGLSLAQLPYSRDLQHRIKPLMNFFVAIFFVSLGLGMSPSDASAEFFPILAFSLFVIFSRPLILLLTIPRMNYSQRTAFLTGITIGQISEFSFIFVAMGVGAGLIPSQIMAITGMVGMITIAASSYLILYNHSLYDWLHRLGLLKVFYAKKANEAEIDQKSDLTGHIIIVGMNTLGRLLAEKLHSRGEIVIALDSDARKLVGLPCRTLLGSSEYMDVLLEAGLPHAKLLVSALRIEEANDLLAFRCRQFDVHCAIHVVDTSMAANLLELDVDYLMLPKVDGVKLQTRYLRTIGVLPS